jgi:hypothetical protein
MQELLVDFITSLDGYASAEGWPGWWGLEGPEYLGWLDEQPERDHTLLMGATTYRLMSGFATEPPMGASADEAETLAELTRTPKVVFSSRADICASPSPRRCARWHPRFQHERGSRKLPSHGYLLYLPSRLALARAAVRISGATNQAGRLEEDP